MKDGPHTNSLEQAGLQGKLLPRSDSIFSIWHYLTEPKCIGDQHFPVSVGLDDVASRNTSQGKFQEIRVSIQVMINRWPGNLGVQTRGHLQLTEEYSQCPGQVTRQKDTCRAMWPGNSMCPLKRTPPANRRTPAIQCHPGILNITHWKWGLGCQSRSPPLIVTNLYLSSLPRLLSHLGFCLLYPLIIV